MGQMTAKRICAIMMVIACLVSVCAGASGYVTLQPGDSGAGVLALKARMYALGYFASDHYSDTYNAVTEERVRLLQKTNGLQETGIATPELQTLIFSDAVLTASGKPAPAPNATRAPATVIAPVTSPELPPVTAAGFLAEDAAPGEFIYADSADGHWIYLSATLSVEIRRYTDPQVPLVWFETEVRCAGESMLRAYLTPGKHPGTGYASPVALAKDNKVVLGLTDDFFGYRLRNDITQGIIIRNGAILSDKTYKANRKSYPCLETLAVFSDGSMKAGLSDAYTAREYLDMGATNVFAFGPVLVTDGKPGAHVLEKDYYAYREPRCALGMIAPGHYLILTVNGRSGSSEGTYLTWLSEKMLALGVTEALNLDGGGTVALMFMGERVNKGGTADTAGNTNIRKVTSIIGFGNSDSITGN
jgi:peptidoglycan hydrolase-like protein with peptidoglycan-binding domain